MQRNPDGQEQIMIKLATIRGMTLRIHPLFLSWLLLSLAMGRGVMAIAGILALLLHELGHIYAARRLHLPISQLELMPFGGCMQMELSDGLSGFPAFFLASAGIAVNFLCSLACVLRLFHVPSDSFTLYFLLSHLSMLLVNLLPVLPLDGGRMLLALLSIFMARSLAFRWLLLAGKLFSALLIAFSLMRAIGGAFRPFFMLLGFYLLYAAVQEERHGFSRYLAAFCARRLRLERGQALPVQTVCAHPDTLLCQLLPQLRPGAYHIIAILDDNACAVRAALDEQHILQAAAQSPASSLRKLIPAKQKANICSYFPVDFAAECVYNTNKNKCSHCGEA